MAYLRSNTELIVDTFIVRIFSKRDDFHFSQLLNFPERVQEA